MVQAYKRRAKCQTEQELRLSKEVSIKIKDWFYDNVMV
jgi:hypothetical protein